MVSTALITNAACAMTDEEVVERVKAGETALFEVIMRRYNQRIYRVIRSILGNDGEAEEVTQEAYVRSYMHLNQFDGRAKFSTWLTKIAVHEALARRNKRQRFVEIDATSGSMEGGMSLESKLPSPEQDVLTQTLRVILEVGYRQAAADLSLGLHAQRSRADGHGRNRRVSGYQRRIGKNPPAPGARFIAQRNLCADRSRDRIGIPFRRSALRPHSSRCV